MDASKTLNKSDCPIFVPVFNAITYAKNMVNELEKINAENVIICDNGSTYPPMVQWLNTISDTHRVVLWNKNLGPRIYSEAIDLIESLPENYIVTDPDLLLNKKMPKNFIEIMQFISNECSTSKVGVALDIFSEGENKNFFDAEQVKKWEFGYWENGISIPDIPYKLYVAPVDTTFAMINKERIFRDINKYYGYSSCMFPAIRIGGPFTARHMGWWKDQPWDKEEKDYYHNAQIWASTFNEKIKLGYDD